ncbi:thioesterase domain-containing protein, partial [Streptomyces sp. YS415]|uniref:thioesterase domain-containing protein n=1 Tax=Streptomyces sp. YS415 TaxID=2944806 RepID=UPI0020227C2E
DPDASLYDLGMDSLALLDLTAAARDLYGVELELSELGHRVSLRDLETRLRARAAQPAPVPASASPAAAPAAVSEPAEDADQAGQAGQVGLEVWQRGTGSDVLCLVHPVGGDIQPYRALVSALGPRLTVCLIADPALCDPSAPSWTLPRRAASYRAALEARFPRSTWRHRLAGWSFGGLVALGMAAEAERAGDPVDGLYLLDPTPPHAAALSGAYDEKRVEEVVAVELRAGRPDTAGPDDASPEARAYARRLAHCCRANLAAMADYEPPRLTATPSVLWLARRASPGLPAPEPADVRAKAWWDRLAGPTSLCHLMDTTHYGIVRALHVRRIAGVLDAGLPPVGGRAEPVPR